MATRKRRPAAAYAASRAFFEELHAKGHQPMLEKASGTLRFDLVGGPQVEHWYLTIAHGNLVVSQRKGRADVVVTVDGRLLDRIVTGTANATAAFLRGAMRVEGDFVLLMAFQRLFAGPPETGATRVPDESDEADHPERTQR